MVFNIGNSVHEVFLSSMNNLPTAVGFQINNKNNLWQMIEQFYLINRCNPNSYTDLKPKIQQIVTKKNGNNYGMEIPTISSIKYNQF